MKREKGFKLLLSLVIIFQFQVIHAQENFLPGYVIMDEADTINGFIDFRDWTKNPDKIYFTKTLDQTPIAYAPSDIDEFMVGKDLFVSGIVETEISSAQTNSLSEDPNFNFKTDTVFLQALIKGNKSLYYYRNTEGKENFYIGEESQFKLLYYKRFIKDQDGKRSISENKKYLGILKVYLMDCAEVDKLLERTSYKKESFLKLFKNYYDCSSSEITFQKVSDKIKTQIGVLAGITSTKVKFKSNEFASFVNADFPSSIDPSGGLYINLVLPKNQGKWSVYNEVLLTNYSVSNSYEQYENENNYSFSTVELGYFYLKVNNLIRYKYPMGDWSLHLNGGISNGFALNETNFKRVEQKFYSTERIIEESALSDTRKYEQGILLGTGLGYNRYSLEFRYERGNGMSEYTSLNSSTRKFLFLFGYRL